MTLPRWLSSLACAGMGRATARAFARGGAAVGCVRDTGGSEADGAARSRRDCCGLSPSVPRYPTPVRVLRRQTCDSGLPRFASLRVAPRPEPCARHDGAAAGAEHPSVQRGEKSITAEVPTVPPIFQPEVAAEAIRARSPPPAAGMVRRRLHRRRDLGEQALAGQQYDLRRADARRQHGKW